MPAGRPRNVESPERMKELFDGYKDSLEDERLKWPKVQYVGKDGIQVTDYPIIPYTIEGFKRYCRNEGVGDIENYFINRNCKYDEFCGICSHIREEIREQQILGGLMGYYNPSITQRLNGLADKKEIDDKREPRVFEIKQKKKGK